MKWLALLGVVAALAGCARPAEKAYVAAAGEHLLITVDAISREGARATARVTYVPARPAAVDASDPRRVARMIDAAVSDCQVRTWGYSERTLRFVGGEESTVRFPNPPMEAADGKDGRILAIACDPGAAKPAKANVEQMAEHYLKLAGG